MMEYVHFLRNINNQSTAICRQIIRVDIEVEYLCDNIIYHCMFLQIQCKKFSMELVWKYERLSSISFLKSSIPVHCGIFHSPYRNFCSIPFHFPFHSMPCPGCRFYIIIIVTFYPNDCSQVENPEAPDFEKIALFPASFQHFCFRVRFRFQPVLLKCFRFHKKLTAFSASASSFRFHFHIPGYSTVLQIL